MECAGNGRALLPGPRPVSQPWLAEAVGTAAWRGTPLAPLLAEAGAARRRASRSSSPGSTAGSRAARSRTSSAAFPLEEALRDDVLLAYEMNGAPLLPQHGFPLRLVVPGWYGMTHVKWLTRITVVAEPFTGYQQAHAYRFRRDEDDEGKPLDRIWPRALMVPPGTPRLPHPRADTGRRSVQGRRPGVVRTCADRDGRVRRRRRRWAPAELDEPPAAPLGLARLARTSGTRPRASTSSAAARATRPATPSRTRPTGTSAATPTTACSACRCVVV